MLALSLALISGCGGGKEAAQAGSQVASGPSAGPILISPLKDTSTYLLGPEGEVLHRWESDQNPGNSVYLLDDGDLLRCIREGDNPVFHGGGEGGRLQRLSWDGELEWDFLWSDETHLAHHDVAPLPNGNVLLISWTRKSKEEALAAGMDPALIQGEAIWPDSVIEVRPVEPDGGEVVWEWHLWDHLVQEFDPERDNYGKVVEHPELVDLNAHGHREQKSQAEQRADLAQMAALGYAGAAPAPDRDAGGAPDAGPPGTGRDARGGGRGGPGGQGEDLCHTNGIDYNAELDQILLSVRSFHELWVIDHSTTTEEAASHTGGRSGKGGDLLYRWGNPINYGRGLAEHQQLFVQHDARWVPAGSPGAGNITVFNNGQGRPGGEYSSVVELTPPLREDGSYALESGEPFGPRRPTWEYVADQPETFYSSFISGAERQPNGNTLVCCGAEGWVFEVSAAGEVLWEYRNKFGEEGRGGPPGGRGRRGPPPSGPGRPGGGPPPLGGPPRGGDFGGGPGGPGGGPGGINGKALFRASRLAPDHPGLARLRD